MLLQIDRKNKESVFLQLLNQIIRLIETGTMEEGYKMPSTRELSEKLGVNRSTIVKVYEELWALGYFESTQGSYTKVRNRKKLISFKQNDDKQNSLFDEPQNANLIFEPNLFERYAHGIEPKETDIVDFYHLVPDHRLIDKKLILSCMHDVVTDEKHNVFNYNHPRGYEPLRKSILKHIQLHCINATDENILITNGSQQSIQLILQTYAKKGDAIAIESPTYAMLFPLLNFFKLKVVEIPMTETGPDLNIFEKHLKSNKIKFFYTIPTFQNPTGITMSQYVREHLLSLCEKHNTIIIEDSIEEELKYFGKVHLPIKSMDTKNIVIYLGTFSKVLAPGLRTGWMIADKPCIDHVTLTKTYFELASGSLNQNLLHRFCQSGFYELHIRKMMRIFRKRMKTTLKLLKQYLPTDKITWIEPIGGFLIWAKLNVSIDSEIDLEKYFLKYGVYITDGKSFFYSKPPNAYFRICISKCNETEIEEGIKRMAKAIEAL